MARLERSVALLVSVSTLAAAGFTWVTIQQASGEQHLTRDGQVTDRYTAAVTNLGDDAEEVRTGGLYALQRIAQDSPPRDAPTIVQVISAYVRGHALPPKKGTTPPAHPANDVDTALRILTAPLDPHTPSDLTGASLYDALLTGAHAFAANLTGVDLTARTREDADRLAAVLEDIALNGLPDPAGCTPWEELRERKLAQLHAARGHVA